MKPEDRKRLKQHIEMVVEHKMPAEELKPCPFCKCTEIVAGKDYTRGNYRVDCLGCSAFITAPSLELAIQYWNTRPIEDRLRDEVTVTDKLLKEATETIGAVIACCTYNSNDDAKIGVYGIDHEAFSRIDQFMTHYIDAVSAGKVSVDVKPVKRENDYQNDNRTNTGG